MNTNLRGSGSIKLWLIILALFILLSQIGTAAFIESWISGRASAKDNTQYEQLKTMITENINEWDNPAWQGKLSEKASHSAGNIRLFDAEGHLIFTYGKLERSADEQKHELDFQSLATEARPNSDFLYTIWPCEELRVAESGEPAGSASLCAGKPTNWGNGTAGNKPFKESIFGRALIWIISLAITMLISSIVINRLLIRPLSRLASAAKQVADGQLDIHLPLSHVTEIRKVSDSFERMCKELNSSLQRLHLLEENRKRFIGSIVHDLRTPVFSIRGYLEGLRTGVADSPTKMKQYVEVCERKAQDLETLVSELFDYTKLDLFEERVRKKRMDLAVFLDHVVKDFAVIAHAKEIQIKVSLSGDRILVWIDAHLLNRAMGNLLSNAIRYTPMKGTIQVDACQEEEFVRISVRDNGPGIAAEDRPKVFLPLYRGEQSRNRQTGGIGLGLSIASKIFELHGGTLTVSNDAEGGAVFIGVIRSDERTDDK